MWIIGIPARSSCMKCTKVAVSQTNNRKRKGMQIDAVHSYGIRVRAGNVPL